MFTARKLTASEQSRNSPNFVELGGSAVQQPTTSPFPQPGHSDTHSGVREDSFRLKCLAVLLADCYFLR
jgi:hypothetical protein